MKCIIIQKELDAQGSPGPGSIIYTYPSFIQYFLIYEKGQLLLLPLIMYGK